MDLKTDLLASAALMAGLPVHPTTGLTAIGVLRSGRPVWPVLGGAPDDEDADDKDQGGDTDDGKDTDADDGKGDEDDDSGDDDKDSKDDGAGKADVVPRSELRKVIKERQSAKAALRARDQELAELKRTNEGESERAAREAAEAAAKSAEAKYKPITIKAALLEAGVKATRIKGALRLVDMDEIEVDAEGDVTGIDEQIDLLKEDYPEFFADPDAEKNSRRERRGSGSRGADGADKQPEKKKPLTATERQAAALLGKG